MIMYIQLLLQSVLTNGLVDTALELRLGISKVSPCFFGLLYVLQVEGCLIPQNLQGWCKASKLTSLIIVLATNSVLDTTRL